MVVQGSKQTTPLQANRRSHPATRGEFGEGEATSADEHPLEFAFRRLVSWSDAKREVRKMREGIIQIPVPRGSVRVSSGRSSFDPVISFVSAEQGTLFAVGLGKRPSKRMAKW